MEKPLAISDGEWQNILDAHKEIVDVLERHKVPAGFATQILIDIERKIDGGIMRTIKEVKSKHEKHK